MNYINQAIHALAHENGGHCFYIDDPWTMPLVCQSSTEFKTTIGFMIHGVAGPQFVKQPEFSWHSVKKRAMEMAMADIREKRDQLLKDTDHFALQDRTLTPEMAKYRQQLRDITEQDISLNNGELEIEWPVIEDE